MASESTEESSVTITLAPELEEWLETRARELGVDRETVLVGLLSSYREAAAIDGEADVDGLAAEVAETDAIREAIDDAVADAVDGGSDDAEALEGRLADRIETVRADFQEKLEDVRERVVQVKREVDGKAPADHTHEEFARVDALGGRVADIEESVAELDADLSDLEASLASVETADGAADEDLASTVEELQERLKTVAWVVSDLRESHENPGGSATLERLKRTAAEADAARAKCERCGGGVEIALLTEPECPHCEATVTEVAPASGFFGKPRLLAAAELESGEDR